MRILFINAKEKGGAGIVVSRLKSVLTRQYGAECFTIVAMKSGHDDSVLSSRNPFFETIEKFIDKASNLLGLQYQFFPFSPLFILNQTKRLRPDIISLHNTHGGYFPTIFLAKISKLAPVVWTLHDMWSFTGNAAHTFGDLSWQQMKNSKPLKRIYPSIGINTGRFLLKQKGKIYSRSDLSIVTPSRWLFNLAKTAPVFKGKHIEHIYNGVDLNVFKPYNKDKTRKDLGIPTHAKVLMFSADLLKDNPWKGGDDLYRTLKIINDNTNKEIHLILTGSGKINWIRRLTKLVIHEAGFVADEIQMAQYVSASDLFLYPTRADNLPNVLIEAIATGVPCVTFDIGGCSEIIINEENGLVVKPFDVEGLARAVLRIINEKELSEKLSRHARAFAENNFSLVQMAQNYHELFRSLSKVKNP